MAVLAGCADEMYGPAFEEGLAYDADADDDAGVEIEQSAQPLVYGDSLRTGLFPELARAKTTSDGKSYSPEACTPLSSVNNYLEMVTVPASDLTALYSQLGAPNPCAGQNPCTKLVQVNTRWINSNLKLTSGSITTDSPFGDDGTSINDLSTYGGDQIIIANNIEFAGDIGLAPGANYVFLARNEIKFGTYQAQTEFGETTVGAVLNGTRPGMQAARGGVKVTRAQVSQGRVSTTVTGTANNGRTGDAGARVALIAPRITGTVRALLSGQPGQTGETLPALECDADAKPGSTEWCRPVVVPYRDTSCFSTQGNSLRSGSGGAGGAGGSLLLVTDSNPTFGTLNFNGGAGGGAGIIGNKRWHSWGTPTMSYGNWSTASPLQCGTTASYYRSYGSAGSAGAAGAAGSRRPTVALSGKIRDFAFWLGARSARRDMLNGRFRSLSTDPDHAEGPRNRAMAIAYFDEVIDNFCEATLPTVTSSTAAPHSLVPVSALRSRVETCNEALTRVSPLRRGLNYLGLSYDAPVYADPQQLKELRNAYWSHYKTTYRAEFQQAITNANDPLFAFFAHVSTDANATATARSAERDAATSDVRRAELAAKQATTLLQKNLETIETKSEELFSLQTQLQAAVAPPEEKRSTWEQIVGPFKDLADIGKALYDTFETMVEVVGGNYAAALGLYSNLKELAETTENAEMLWGTWRNTDPPIPVPTANTVLTQSGLAAMSDQLCQAAPAKIGATLVALELASSEVSSANVTNRTKALAILDTMELLVADIEQLSRANCGLFQQVTLAGRDVAIADERLAVAELRLRLSQSVAASASALVADARARQGRFDLQRDTACRQGKIWEEQILLYDFLAARAQHFGSFREPNTRAARGEFTWELLGGDASQNTSNDAAYDNELLTDAVSFNGWSASRALVNDYLVTDNGCVNGLESADACETQRATLGQLGDTGLVRLRLEEGPRRFGTENERLRGRVTSAAATLLGPSTSDRAVRISHDARMTFVNGQSTERYRWSTAAGRDLCSVLESRNNALRAQVSGLPQSLNCAGVPPHFLTDPFVPTPALFVWRGGASWSEATDHWNLFGASVRGEWTVDFRPMYRELNRLDYCYDALASGTVDARDADCIGRAFMPADCESLSRQAAAGDANQAAAAQSCLASALPTRVSAFQTTCSPYVVTSSLQGDPPADCDRVCGPTCQQRKRDTTGMRFSLTVRSHN